ncbi:MAG: hypothetical protein IT222_04805 [Crocinitomix sp.]|nr:hypothetical protein [Crocinitomix sp.]
MKSSKIEVLNFGTFHFGETTDASTTEFDEENKELHKEVREISKMIAKFQPTIICVETLPEVNDKLNELYQKFLKNPSELDTRIGEISMILEAKTKYFVHPIDTDWMHDIIIDWATDKKNKIKLLKGTSAIVVPHSH